MDITKLSQSITNLLNDPEQEIEILNRLYDISTNIASKMEYKDDPKTRVLNLLFINAYKSFKSFHLLMQNNSFNDAKLFTRKIIEILIRIEYLSKNNYYNHFFRVKSQDQAKILSSLLSTRSIKYIANTALWRIRQQILDECKGIYIDKGKGDFIVMPNIDEMADEVGLLVLYIEKYSTFSKFVHCNMSIENYFLYKDGDNFHYSFKDDSYSEGNKKTLIDDTLYCFYKIIKKYSSEMSAEEEVIQQFEKDYFLFTSFDLITGTTKSNVDITRNIIKSLFGEEMPEDDNDSQYEVLFLEDDVGSLKRDWTKLEKLIKQKENELNNL